MKLADADIDLHPPRAHRRTLRFPGWARIKIATSELLSDQIDHSIDFLSYGGALQFSRHMIVRWLIPGWPQLTFNRLFRARFFFCGYCFFLIFGILLMGTILGAWLIGMAFAMHFGSIADAVFTAKSTMIERLGAGSLLGLCLFLLLYLPVGWSISRFVRPQILVNNIGSFQAGDIVWIWQDAEPVPGEYLHYVNSSALINNSIPQYRTNGSGVSLVLAGPGQVVSIENGILLIDGKSCPVSIDAQFTRDQKITFKVPVNSWFIDPTGRIPVPNALITEQNIQQVCLIQSVNIRGQVIYRSYPFSRITFF
ncbi:MAG TPA: hypothetical protein DDZ90_14575 [Planctomycetaceae bacterium]|nr:hypothetical protein [Gimesia sp.]HBL44609.1 hypothetical protein [Planctomycetaceae bacterium]